MCLTYDEKQHFFLDYMIDEEKMSNKKNNQTAKHWISIGCFLEGNLKYTKSIIDFSLCQAQKFDKDFILFFLKITHLFLCV